MALGRAIRQLAERWRVGALLAAALEHPEAAPLGVDPAAVATPAAAEGSSPLAAAPSGGGPSGGVEQQQLEKGCVLAQSCAQAAS